MRGIITGSALIVGLSIAAAGAAPPQDPLAPRGEIAPPPAAPIRPVTETLWGTAVTDSYRYMEALDPATLDWMKAQGAYTRSILDAIKPLAALQKRVANFTGSFGFIDDYVTYGGRAFYKERTPGSDNFDLMIQDDKGTRKLVDVAALRAAHDNKPYAINYFLASPDGSRVAVGISEGGSENATLYVYDAASGAQIAEPIDRVQIGATAWTDDGKRLYFNRLAQIGPDAPPTQKYLNSTLEVWDLEHEPRAILGATVPSAIKFEPQQFPVVTIAPGAAMAAALNINGVQNEIEAWLAPVAEATTHGTKWTPFVARSDDVTGMEMRGREVFLLSHKDAPTFQVLALQAGDAIEDAKVLVPAKADRVIDSIHAASDALYVLARRGAYSILLRVPAGKTAIEEVPLPHKGHVTAAFSDPREPGLTIDLTSWVVPPAELSYGPANKRFTDLRLGVRPDFDGGAFTVKDLEAKAKDGAMVPLSLVQPKGASGRQVAVIEAYGSYGISLLADFRTRRTAMMREGITYGICHVRGGGELGEAWRLGGKDASKPNTWNDLVACAEDLLARGVTIKDKLFIMGGSAGGITVGRAVTERPDLFAGAIEVVPAGNELRMEFTPSGPANVPEFGSVKTEQGFKNLYAMDTIQHIHKGTQYPAIMVTTGLNDPRVAPWAPAKVAAAFQALGTARPVLLRIDEEAGHGIGSTRTQTDRLTADWIAFVFWRAGRPAWRPDLGARAAGR
jgi:prolyl oligopeptidase